MTRDAMLVLRLPKDVKDALSKAAEADGQSMSALAVEVLSTTLRKRGVLTASAEPKAKRAKARKA